MQFSKKDPTQTKLSFQEARNLLAMNKTPEKRGEMSKQLKTWGWNLVEFATRGDGNSLYRCFAHEIFGDPNRHDEVRESCLKYMVYVLFFVFLCGLLQTERNKTKQKGNQGLLRYEMDEEEVNIMALSEVYNVRVRVFQLDKGSNKLFMAFDCGQYNESLPIPLVLLGRHQKKHYSIIKDPQAYLESPRPLGVPASRRSEKVSIRGLRLQKEKEKV